jgi:hypothetical protein
MPCGWIGTGDIWKHDEELSTDGVIGDKAYYFTVTSVNVGTRTVSIESLSGETNMAEGWSALHLSSNVQLTEQFMVGSIVSTGTGPQTYDITIGEDWNIDSFAVGDIIIAGGVPIFFGPIWTDFASPTYKHHVRALQIDTNGFEGVLYVDHYLDSFETTPQETVTVYANSRNRHIRVKFRGGSGYTYGFRIRGYATTKAHINTISRIFDTEV